MQKILVIEPDKTSRRTLQNLLSFMGYEEAAAATCEEALQIAAEQNITMILFNLSIPSMDCQNLRELLFAAGIEVRMVAYAEGIKPAATAAHIDDYLESPYIASALNQKIRFAV